MLATSCAVCLKELPMFQGLETKQFDKICQSSAKLALHKGEVLFNQGDKASSLYLLKEGSIKLSQFTEEGKEVILEVMGKGDIIGETSLFQQGEFPVTAIAMEESRVCSISRKALEQLIIEEPLIAIEIIASLGRKLYDSQQQRTELSTLTVSQRIMRLFLRLAKDYGQETSEGTVVKLHLTQQDIANLVGVSRVMVVQVLKELKAEGRLIRSGKYYSLKDRCF